MIKFNPAPSPELIRNSKTCSRGFLFNNLENEVFYTFSGKSAIGLLLKYFRENGQLKDKNAQLLVPKWMGNWVYMTMQNYCFPSLEFSKNISGVWIYHQWGFPQKVEEIINFCREKGLFTIEDCAHLYDPSFDEGALGTFSDASLFSLAKMFPSILGGAIFSNNPQIHHFLAKQKETETTSLWMYEILKTRHNIELNDADENYLKLVQCYAIYDQFIACPEEAILRVRQSLIDTPYIRRQFNYQAILDEFNPYMTYQIDVDHSSIFPWVCPLFFDEKRMLDMANKLNESGIESGVYNFDINRNLISPKYQKCLIVPCHQQLSQNELDMMISIIKKFIN